MVAVAVASDRPRARQTSSRAATDLSSSRLLFRASSFRSFPSFLSPPKKSNLRYVSRKRKHLEIIENITSRISIFTKIKSINFKFNEPPKFPGNDKFPSKSRCYRAFHITFPAKHALGSVVWQPKSIFSRYLSLSAPEQKGLKRARGKRSEEGLHGRTPAVNFTTSSPGTTSSQNRH